MKKYVLSFLLAILFIGHGTAQTDLQTWVNQRQYEKALAQSMLMDMDTLDYWQYAIPPCIIIRRIGYYNGVKRWCSI